MITFALDPKSGVPIYRQIQDQIRYGIASGLLEAGEQLPTVRALAVELSVNPNTVIKAYSELEREGMLTTEQGTGTFVAHTCQRRWRRDSHRRSRCNRWRSPAGSSALVSVAAEKWAGRSSPAARPRHRRSAQRRWRPRPGRAVP